MQRTAYAVKSCHTQLVALGARNVDHSDRSAFIWDAFVGRWACTKERGVCGAGLSFGAPHVLRFIPTGDKGLLAQSIRKRGHPMMMSNMVTAATSAAPQIIPTPEAMKAISQRTHEASQASVLCAPDDTPYEINNNG